MLLPVEWLEDFIELKATIGEVAEMLTMVGLEVEAIETSGDNIVFDIGITPNRPDCLSVIGIARELKAITGQELKIPDSRVEDDFEGDFQVSIDSPLCNRYTGRIIKGVKIGDSPEWIKRRLELSGIRSINNIVDITNYVLLELGHPLHAFDLDTLKGNKIRVGTAGKALEFKTLDGAGRTIPGDGLLIWDAERPIAIAGIMGGLETEVSAKTTNVFLESAYFDPASIRRTSRLLGLKTESSYRFERGTDIEGLSVALDRATLLIKRLCGGVVSTKIDLYPEKLTRPEIGLRYTRVTRLLGIEIPRNEILKILDRLDFSTISSNEAGVLVTVPSYRVDIQKETDIIEEIGRHYGYEKIPSHIPFAPIVSVPSVSSENNPPISPLGKGGYRGGLFSARIKEVMKASGFNEAINFSFMNPEMLDVLNIPEGDERRKTVTLMNPLRQEDSSLRTFLLPSLIENLIHNLNQGIRDIKLFEVSRVFINKGEKLPLERPVLGAIYLYQQGQRLWEDKGEIYYLLKGVIEKVLRCNMVGSYSFRPTEESFLHPNKSADVYAGDERLGYAGTLSPGIKATLDLRHLKAEIGVFELDISGVLKHGTKEISYTPLPRFPYVQRDIALLVDITIPAEEILALIKSFPSELIEDSWIFDFYQGEKIPAGKKSLGFTIRYRAKDRTLTDKEVETLHQEIIAYLIKKTGGELRS